MTIITGVIQETRAFAGLDGWLDHGFGTRRAENWPPGGFYANLRQIHSDKVVTVAGEGAGSSCDLGEGDGLVTAAPGLWIGIRTADCVPVLLADPVRRAIAAVHAGWRGTAAGIAFRTLDRLAAEFGSRPDDIRAAIGPAIGVCCYEVGPDVAGEFGAGGVVETRPGAVRPFLDLASTLERQLLAAGIRPEHLGRSKDCTKCDAAGRFHSYRRDGQAAGRMIAAIRIRP